MNCNESQRLRTLLSRLLLELHHRGNASGLGAGRGPNMGMGVVPESFLGREVTSTKGDDAYLYILLIMIFYACLAGGLILAYTRSASSSRPRMRRPRPARNTSGPCPPQTLRLPPVRRLKAGVSSPPGCCLPLPRAQRVSRTTAAASLPSSFLSLGTVPAFSFSSLPGFASSEAQTVMRDQETLSGRSTTYSRPVSPSSLSSPRCLHPHPAHPTALNCLCSLVFRKPMLKPSGN